MNFFEDFEKQAGLPNRIVAAAAGRSLAADTLLRKLAKHGPRKQAVYLAEWIGWGKEVLPNEAKVIARKAGLVYDPKMGVGYPHETGGYHWFAIKKE